MPQRIQPEKNSTYGTPQPLQNAAIQPIIARRAPTTLDTGYPLGQLWVWEGSGEWILNQVAGGVATWNPTGGGAGVVSTINTLPPTAGNITIAGTASQIAVANAGSTVTLSIPAVASNTTSFTSGSFITSSATLGTTFTANSLTPTGSNADIDLLVNGKGTGGVIQSRGLVGSDVTIETTNTDNTNLASRAGFEAAVGGGGAGDPYVNFLVSGAGQFTMGIDNSDSDNFKISTGAALGTNDIISASSAGSINFPKTPAFFGYLAAPVLNATGNGATYTLGTDALTIVYDQGTNFTTGGVFTAPVAGIYDLRTQITVSNTTIATTFVIEINTTTQTFTYHFQKAAGTETETVSINTLAKMAATDTAYVTLTVSGEAGNTNTIDGAANGVTYFCGTLVA